jgi:hypothetical protein
MKSAYTAYVLVAIVIVALLFALTLPSPEDYEYTSGTYVIDGQTVTLTKGRAETSIAPGSASKMVTEYFGNDVSGDLNGDGLADAAFVLTQTSGGSGTFYYVVAALRTESGYTGTNAILLGDRIAPQTLEVKDGRLVANYAERKPDEPFSVRPSVGVSTYMEIQNNVLQKVNYLP